MITLDGELNHRLTLLALAAFSVVWVTALGAAVGSFLNVVIYRLPRDMSLVRPKSHCPRCGTSIRASDNVPVVGWLRLRGRCRACGNPISPRYPLVESATAILFLGLAHLELFTGGANLPGGPSAVDRGLAFVLWHLRPALIGVYLYHATLLCSLLSSVLIVWDGFAPPRRLVGAAALVGLIVPMFLPMAHPVRGLPQDVMPSVAVPLGEWAIPIAPSVSLEALVGTFAGIIAGLCVALAVPSGPTAKSDRWGTVIVGSMLGMFLGWQAAVSCALAGSLFVLLNALVSWIVPRRLPATACLAATVLVQLPLWRTLDRYEWWPSRAGWNILRLAGWPESRFVMTSLAAALGTAAVLSLVARFVTARDHAAESASAQRPDGEPLQPA